ncbi:MAG: PTS transporter subunit EIIC, partial [Culicoidibacterales bacterium]
MQNNSIFGVLQRVGRSFMLPIAILPVAGLFLGVGGSFTNTTLIEAYGWTAVLGPGTVLNTILTIVSSAGDVIFGNLPLIFAIAIALGMAKAEKATAALSGAIAFLVMQATISATLLTTGQIAVV